MLDIVNMEGDTWYMSTYLRTYLLAYSLTCFTYSLTHLAVGHAHLTRAHLELPLRPQPLDDHLYETHVT